jgi:hypothetical protein
LSFLVAVLEEEPKKDIEERLPAAAEEAVGSSRVGLLSDLLRIPPKKRTTPDLGDGSSSAILPSVPPLPLLVPLFASEVLPLTLGRMARLPSDCGGAAAGGE